MQYVEINNAPGYVDRFEAILIPGLHEFRVADDQEPVSVVTTEVDDIHVVPSRCVRFTDWRPARAYRREWAAKAGRPESEVYVPEALR